MRSLIATLALSLIACSSGRALAFQRDHLTPQEADHVRDAQRIDKRIEVFIKAIDRRIEALQGQPQNASKKEQKEIEEWGEVKGTRAELIADIAGILDEAITNLDDAAERLPQKEFLPKALEKMAEAAKRYVAVLRPLREQISDRRERESLEQAIEMAEQIIEAVPQNMDKCLTCPQRQPNGSVDDSRSGFPPETPSRHPPDGSTI